MRSAAALALCALALAGPGAAAGAQRGGSAEGEPSPTAAPASPPAERVVAMNPSLAAMLVAIGARDVLVGVDDYSRGSQSELAGLPAVGGLANPSLERVVALRPDLVVLVPSFEQRDFRARLRGVGIPLLELDPKSFDEVLAALRALGAAVGRRDAAEARIVAIEQARARVEQAVRGLPRPRALLVLQRDPLFVVGRGSFIAEMLESAGAHNLGAELDGPYPRVSLEWLVSRAPEVLLDSSRDATPAPDYWARLPSLPAVRSGRVVSLSPGTATLPGPWLDRGLWILARALHGDALPRGAAP
jgi:iron complex transport system substrate-binding protein